MAMVFKVSRAGYYRYIGKKPSARDKTNEELTRSVKIIFENSRQTYGSPRIHAALQKIGNVCSRKRVAKIMQQNKIKAKNKRRWKAVNTSNINSSNVAPNALKQNFFVSKPNLVWVTDITYVRTNEGWLYVSAVLDLYSRKIVGLSMGSYVNTNLVIRSLEQAICHRRRPKGIILHSDRGTQYTSDEYKQFTQKHGFIISMSAQGNCYDNAVIESFFHTLKTELIFSYTFLSRQTAMESIFEYVEVFYNRQRIHSTLNFLSPYEFEKQFVPVLESSSMKLALPAKEASVFAFAV